MPELYIAKGSIGGQCRSYNTDTDGYTLQTAANGTASYSAGVGNTSEGFVTSDLADEHERYDKPGDSWANKTVQREHHWGTGNVWDGVTVWTIGGSVSHTDSYDVSGNAWSTWANTTQVHDQLPYAWWSLADADLIFVGGDGTTGAGSNPHSEYSISGNSYTIMTVMNYAAYEGSSGRNGAGYNIAAGATAGAHHTKTESYDESGDSWADKTAPPAITQSTTGTQVTTSLTETYILAGLNNRNYVYDAVADSYDTNTVWPDMAGNTGSMEPGYVAPVITITGYWGVPGSDPAQTVLLLHCDGTDEATDFPDSSSSGHTATANGDAQIDTASKKFGTASGLFDGAGSPIDSLSIPQHADFNLTGDFTIEFWYRHASAHGTANAVIANSTSTGSAIGWYCEWVSNAINFRYSAAGGGWTSTTTKSLTPSVGTWYHIAVTRKSGTIRVFVDGVAGTPVSYATALTSSANLYIGATSDGGAGHIGQLDDIRIIKDLALYEADFTPPTAPAGQVSSDGWTEFSTDSIEEGSDYGTEVGATGQKTVYWRPSVDLLDFEGDIQIKMRRE